MRLHLRFIDESRHAAPGSDSTFFNVQNTNLDRLHRKALAHARSLRGVNKTYIGYTFLQGPSLLQAYPASLKDVFFTARELEWIEQEELA